MDADHEGGNNDSDKNDVDDKNEKENEKTTMTRRVECYFHACECYSQSMHGICKLCSHWHKQNCDASTSIINPYRSAKHGFEAVQKKNGQAGQAASR